MTAEQLLARFEAKTDFYEDGAKTFLTISELDALREILGKYDAQRDALAYIVEYLDFHGADGDLDHLPEIESVMQRTRAALD